MLQTRLVQATLHAQRRLALSISAPGDGKRKPQDIMVVVDKSGSMSSDATPNLPDDERDGITTWDLILHCLKVLFDCLGDDDRLGVVLFDQSACVAVPIARMTSAHKTSLHADLARTSPGGGTQIWSGIHLGLETLHQAHIADAPRNRTILVFTDGVDGDKPHRGNLFALNQWIDGHAEWCRTMTMHTVGFGCELDSRELYEMAARLGGTFSHIPESSTAGTILIHRGAAELATSASHVHVAVTKTDGTVVQAALGAIRIGQTRTHPIATPLDDIARIDVSYFDGRAHESCRVDISTVDEDAPTVTAGWVKLDLVETLDHLILTLQTTAMTRALSHCTDQLAQFRARTLPLVDAHPYVRDCIADVDDQLHKAVEKEKWCDAWGKHYLRSYRHATANELVNNFRDHAIQHFASPAFTTLQEHCEKIFLAAPPIPKKTVLSRRSSGYTSARVSTVAATPTLSASQYQDRYYGGCFHPEALVYLSDGRTTPVGRLRKGDAVSCSGGRVATVRCVVWSTGRFEMVTLDGFTLTATHPVRNPHSTRHEWIHPKHLATNRSEATRVVNLLLDAHHEIVGVCGRDQSRSIVCCTLAHGLHDDVVEHDYLGTDAVARDLAQLPGFDDGMVHATFTRSGLHVSGVVDCVGVEEASV